MHLKKRLVLASQSPRRKILFQQLGVAFDVKESYVDEIFDLSQSPEQNVKQLSYQKASAVAKVVDNAIVVGADTVVVLNGKILGKPVDSNDAVAMLRLLSGKTHEVYTGFCLIDRPTNQQYSDVEVTKVTFRALGADEIQKYVAGGSPLDKAGAYGIQDDYGAVFVEKIEGCFYNVVGFPLTKFYLAMEQFQKQLQLN